MAKRLGDAEPEPEALLGCSAVLSPYGRRRHSAHPQGGVSVARGTPASARRARPSSGDVSVTARKGTELSDTTDRGGGKVPRGPVSVLAGVRGSRCRPQLFRNSTYVQEAAQRSPLPVSCGGVSHRPDQAVG